jgi:hypothetical protein
MKHLGTVEIKQPNGDYFVTEIMRDGGKLITGSPTNAAFLRDQWEVTIEEFADEQEALEELYAIVEEAAMEEQ